MRAGNYAKFREELFLYVCVCVRVCVRIAVHEQSAQAHAQTNAGPFETHIACRTVRPFRRRTYYIAHIFPSFG